MLRHRIACLGMLAALAGSPLSAQDTTAVAERLRPPRGAQFLIPAGGLLVPGLGQYIQGAWGPGLGYTAVAGAGLAVAINAGSESLDAVGIPRAPRDQLAYEASHVYFTAGALSAWDAFRRSVPALQREGKYDFLPPEEDLGDLLSAPFDPTFLRRWTTWVDLAYTGLITGLVLSQREPGVAYEPFRLHDAAFAASLSFNAATGEEAMFRGWLFPVLHQNLGRRFWLSNPLQAALFSIPHAPQAGSFTYVIAAWSLYEGWLVRRNGWSVRESIFHHFWYDVAVVAASLLVDEVDAPIRISVPTLRF